MEQRLIKYRLWNGTKMEEVGGIVFHTDNSYHVNDEYPVNDHEAPGGNPPYRLLAWTGLLDKNGKEIFEGDIVRFSDKNWVIQYKPYLTGGYSLNSWHNDGSPHIKGLMMAVKVSDKGDIEFDLEVLGNLFETPNLLEK